MNSDVMQRFSYRSAEALLLKLKAQEAGVKQAAAMTHATNCLINEALEGVMAAQQAVIYEDENPPELPVDCRPWAVATVSAPRKAPPLELPPSPLLYVTEKQFVELGMFDREIEDDGRKSTIQSSIRSYQPRFKIKAWNLDALVLGLIREGWSHQYSQIDNSTCALVDFVRLEAPDDVTLPTSPAEWIYLFTRVHAQYAPDLALSLAIPATIIRNGKTATYANVITLSRIEIEGKRVYK